MYNHYSKQFERSVSIIHPGEFFSSNEDIIISTILGSCIAVALYDPVNRQGGLNHFMLPGDLHGNRFILEETGRYGMYAMELLINDLLKKGARKANLTAKVFGGGHVLHGTSSGSVPEGNIRFALEFLETENIPIISRDIGGTEARKVFFFPRTSKTLLKRFSGKFIKPVEREETAYLARLKQKVKKHDEVQAEEDVTFF